MSFDISDSGYVYICRARSKRKLLGHISEVLQAPTPLGEKVRKWWEAQMKRVWGKWPR